ncbi:hypothetical protein BIV24_21450 [Streptomyces colonosanans]|uniref:Uncharacterized protein n=1 Tax=Streptomyces colonosanans TaxID=1428652 RepID=A0A1S2P420_9ACTN|nr:hypothetical protein BIV24_21450 [Streptomyces colonosanans]
MWFTRIALARPGARVGWQRQRAWMEVFSSALITYSSSPSGTPCQVRAYRSSTRWALVRKSGSVMKIQEWCCQGLSASLASQRRTVEADTNVAMPRTIASWASSGHDQRDSGTPLSAGNRQASALTSAICNAVKAGGRPERRRSASPARRCSANLPRHLRTVSRCRLVSRAIRALERPLAACRTTCARARSRYSVL